MHLFFNRVFFTSLNEKKILSLRLVQQVIQQEVPFPSQGSSNEERVKDKQIHDAMGNVGKGMCLFLSLKQWFSAFLIL